MICAKQERRAPPRRERQQRAETVLAAPRSTLARERAAAARAALADCKLCAHECGVDRLVGDAGLCHAGAEARVFSAQVEVSDELELIPTFAIALCGCDLRCDFCITGGPSWNSRGGDALVATRGVSAVTAPRRRGVVTTPLAQLAARAVAALAKGARTVMILGGEPTVHLPTALEIVAAMPDDAKLVWKTNAHGSARARELLDGMFDVWLADFKFGNDECALRLARVSDYVRVVKKNLLWANNHSELIVRHLLMPGHAECCWRPVAEWLAENLSGVKVNLRSGFWPAWHSSRHVELRGTVAEAESEAAFQIARDCGLNLIK